MDRDKLSNIEPKQAANAAMQVVDALQRFPAGTQLMGLATAWKMAMDLYGVSISDVMTYSGNLINDTDGRRPEFSAVAEYLEKEWS